MNVRTGAKTKDGWPVYAGEDDREIMRHLLANEWWMLNGNRGVICSEHCPECLGDRLDMMMNWTEQ